MRLPKQIVSKLDPLMGLPITRETVSRVEYAVWQGLRELYAEGYEMLDAVGERIRTLSEVCVTVRPERNSISIKVDRAPTPKKAEPLPPAKLAKPPQVRGGKPRPADLAVEATKVLSGSHVAVPEGLLRELIEAGFGAYAPAFGGSIDRPYNAANAATNILTRYRLAGGKQ